MASAAARGRTGLMRFRLFRSRAFWFGVPGWVFLLWGWWLSTGHLSRAGFGGERPWEIGLSGGEAYVQWDSATGPDWREFHAWYDKSSADEASDLRRYERAIRRWNPTRRIAFIPFYWLVLCYVTIWTGLVWWRRWKYRHVAEGA